MPSASPPSSGSSAKSSTSAAPQRSSTSLIRYRKTQTGKLPGSIGVYALNDLDNVPLYIGQSTDGIRARVLRHLTSARSDVIANRMIDIWEVAFVWCWAVSDPAQLNPLENHLFHRFHPQSRLMNGSACPAQPTLPFDEPTPVMVQVMPDEEIESRKRYELRLPRQANHFGSLLDHFLNVKDSKELLLALAAHFARLERYFHGLRNA